MRSPELGPDNWESTHSKELPPTRCLLKAVNAVMQGEIDAQDVFEAGTRIPSSGYEGDNIACDTCGSAASIFFEQGPSGVQVDGVADLPGRSQLRDCPMID